MATTDELNELKARISRLRLHEQLHLFEMVFADHRRQREETLAAMLAQDELLRAMGRGRSAAGVLPEAKREAG